MTTPMPSPNNRSYIVAIVVMMGLGAIGVILITILRPNHDNTLVIGSLLGFLTPTTLSLLALMKAQETHLSVNSRLSAWILSAESEALARGRLEGHTAGRADADARTDALASTIGEGVTSHDAWERERIGATELKLDENTTMTREIRDAVVPKPKP